MSTEPWSTLFLDPALLIIKNNVNYVALCSSKPVNYVQAMSTYKLASAAISSGDFTGPADGYSSGRSLTIALKSGISVTATGVANYIAYVNNGTSTLYYVKRTSQISLTVGGTVSIPAVIIGILDPTL